MAGLARGGEIGRGSEIGGNVVFWQTQQECMDQGYRYSHKQSHGKLINRCCLKLTVFISDMIKSMVKNIAFQINNYMWQSG